MKLQMSRDYIDFWSPESIKEEEVVQLIHLYTSLNKLSWSKKMVEKDKDSERLKIPKIQVESKVVVKT